MSVEFYIGDRIAHGSERALITQVASHLAAQGTPAIILANFNLNTTQIDLVVATDRLTLLLEAKACSSPIRGGTNGPWEIMVAGGQWKTVRNYYQQTLDARHGFRDAAVAFGSASDGYPAATLMMVPNVHEGSSVYRGDFKVRIGSLSDLPFLLGQTSTLAQPLAHWRQFARHHGLTRASTLETAISPTLNEADAVVHRYAEAYRRTYGPVARGLVPFPCGGTELAQTSDDTVRAISEGASVLLIGPSGCGKSLLAHSAGLASLEEGRIPIVAYAKEFSGHLGDVLNREATLLDMPSGAALLAACRHLEKPVTLILDGYNECADQHRDKLVRSLAAASRRYLMSAVVTSSVPLVRPDLVALSEVRVPAPDLGTKKAIAALHTGNDPLSTRLLLLLESTSSGLEASLVGQVARDASASSSRYALFDTLVRMKFGSDASQAISALTSIANAFAQRIAFSMSLRDLERLAEQASIGLPLLARLQGAGLLVPRGDRFSFAHELYLSAFTAEAILRRAGNDAEAIAAALRRPQNTQARTFIVGGIDDISLLDRVLSEVTDPDIFSACFDGQCGAVARSWATRARDRVLEKMRAELPGIAFELKGESGMQVIAVASSLTVWTDPEMAVVASLTRLFASGQLLDDALQLASLLDVRLNEEAARLREPAKERKIGIRGELFRYCYVFPLGPAPALSTVFQELHSGLAFIGREARSVDFGAVLRVPNLTFGQLHLIITLFRHGGLGISSIAKVLAEVIPKYWPRAPYHLCFDLMDAARSAAWKASAEDKATLIAAIEGLPDRHNAFISTAIIDALKSLGALDDDQERYVQTVRDTIARALENPDDEDQQRIAYSTWYGQFDHPYEGAFVQAIGELSSDDAKRFRTLALKAVTREEHALFVDLLIIELANYGDVASGEIIAHWTNLPDRMTSTPQDDMGAYLLAHIALGRLAYQLNAAAPPSADKPANAMLAAGRILYWLNRVDLSLEERKAHCRPAVSVLTDKQCTAATAVVREFSTERSIWKESIKLVGGETAPSTIEEAFTTEVATILRQCISDAEHQIGYFRFFNLDDLLAFALAGLGRVGNALDIPLLTPWVLHPRLGNVVIEAIARFDGPSHSGAL